MTTIKRLVFDYDYLKYSIASVCEKRTIIATHRDSGNEKEFKTRTEFWGHHAKKEGGWLAERNLERVEEGRKRWTPDDFDISDKQVAEPVSHMNNVVKGHIKGVCDFLGATSYYGYIGKGASWRVDASTIVEYKGDRKDAIKPLMLDEIEHYLKRSHGAEEVAGLEVDDQVVIDCMKDPSLTLVGVDKDYNGVEPLNLYNPDTMSLAMKIDGLGSLWEDAKGKVRGVGRKFFYFQVLSGDSADCYYANSACPEIKWADKSAYKLLEPCKTDAECWEAIVSGYQKLYPAPREIVGWRGDKLTVDAKYVLRENCTMAHMLRTPDDKYDLDAVLKSHGVAF